MGKLSTGLDCKNLKDKDIGMFKVMLTYQFCPEAANILSFIDVDKLKICFSKSTLRARAIIYNGKVFAMIRASDFYIVPHTPLGILLHKVIPFPRRRVIVVNEMVDDILKGSSIFAKHIIAADESLRPFEEVLVVNEDDKLIGLGRTILDYTTMVTATHGVAVQLREKIVGEEL